MPFPPRPPQARSCGFTSLTSFALLRRTRAAAVLLAFAASAWLAPLLALSAEAGPATIPELKEKYGIRVSAYLYHRTLEEYRGRPRALAEALASFGIDDAYLHVSTGSLSDDAAFRDELRSLIQALRERGVLAHHATFSHENAYGAERDAVLAALAEYQEHSASEERFAGIHFDIEAHIMRENNAGWRRVAERYGIERFWDSESGYGPDGPNDRVMQWVLAQIAAIREQTADGNFVYSQALGHFYGDRVERGELSLGGVNDFLAECDHVSLMNYTDDPERLIRQARLEVENATSPDSVEILVKTADNRVGPLSTTFANREWSEMMDALVALCEAFEGTPAFRGVGFFEFQSLEALWSARR